MYLAHYILHNILLYNVCFAVTLPNCYLKPILSFRFPFPAIALQWWRMIYTVYTVYTVYTYCHIYILCLWGHHHLDQVCVPDLKLTQRTSNVYLARKQSLDVRLDKSKIAKHLFLYARIFGMTFDDGWIECYPRLDLYIQYLTKPLLYSSIEVISNKEKKEIQPYKGRVLFARVWQSNKQDILITITLDKTNWCIDSYSFSFRDSLLSILFFRGTYIYWVPLLVCFP